MDPNFPELDIEVEEQMDPLYPDVGARDEEEEERMCMLIVGRAAAPVGDEDAVNLDDFSSQFLNDSGEGVEEGEICRDNEVTLRNSGEVY